MGYIFRSSAAGRSDGGATAARRVRAFGTLLPRTLQGQLQSRGLGALAAPRTPNGTAAERAGARYGIPQALVSRDEGTYKYGYSLSRQLVLRTRDWSRMPISR